MKTKLIIGVLLLFAALLIFPAAADDSSAPILPLQVYGTVSYTDGENLPAGTVITATVDGVTSTYTVTQAGKIGGAGTFDGKFLINGTTNGSTVTFKINGLPAAVTGGCTFTSGDVKQIALTMEKKEVKVETEDPELEGIFKEKPVIAGVSGTVPADFNPETFTLTITVIPEEEELPPTPETAEVFKAIEITASQQGVSVLIPITITDAELRDYFNNDRSTVAVYHYNGTVWEKIPVKDLEIKTGETVFWIQADSFSPFIIVSETEESNPSPSPTETPTSTPTTTPTQSPKPSTSGGSGTSSQDVTQAWTNTPTPTPTQTPADIPTIKPADKPTPQAKSPAPFIGILAGLGAAAVLFGLRRK